MNERNQELLHRLLEQAAEQVAPAGTARRMVGDYFAAAMDEECDRGGRHGPLAELLERIDAVASVADIRELIAATCMRIGVGAFHSLGIAPDFEDADAYLVYVGQGGLGPARARLLHPRRRTLGALRAAYTAHVANQLGNLGRRRRREARDAAERILAFETRLAEASYTAEQMRDVQLTMNRHEVASLDELMPDFGLAAYVVRAGRHLPHRQHRQPRLLRRRWSRRLPRRRSTRCVTTCDGTS